MVAWRKAALAAIGAGASCLGGCAPADYPIIAAAGPVASTERDLLFRAVAIMMIVVVPVFVLTAWFSWRYRATNRRSHYQPDWMSRTVDIAVWVVPALIVLALGYNVWVYTHRLDPYRPLESAAAPLDVEVVAEDWKWLFIYPDQGVASVNELAFPSGRPLSLTITSDTVMNAFFIPALGSQIFAMAGMVTHLNLLADRPGHFAGRNTQYSGEGFSGQSFDAVAMSGADFAAWVAGARRSPDTLDAAAYARLAKPSAHAPVSYYASVAPGLFESIVRKYRGGAESTAAMAAPVTRPPAANRRMP